MKKGIIYSALLAILLLMSAAAIPPSGYEFTGKITDGIDPLIGAAILIKGTKEGTTTNFDGNFSISYKDSCVTLVIAYTGFESKEMDVCSGDCPISVVLNEGVELEEVTITSSGISREKKTLGYSSTTIKMSERPRHRIARKPTRKSKKKKDKVAGFDTEMHDVTAPAGMMDAKMETMVEGVHISPARMEAGQLTAAEWNDLKNWNDWLDISTEDLGEWGRKWGINPGKRYSAIIRNSNHTPLPNATVQLINKEGNIEWQALTDNTGRAELWLKSGKAGKIKVLYNGIEQEQSRISSFKKGINTIILNTDCPEAGGIEIVFAVDATGSMGDEIAYLQAELTDVLQRVTETPIVDQLRAGAVFYRDHEDDYLVRQSPLSDDIKTTLTFIDEQSAGGGGDNPEAVEVGLEAAIDKMDWSEDAIARVIFFILDAPPHYTPEIEAKMKKLMEKSAQKGIRIIPMLASNAHGETEYIMRTLAIGTNGRLLFLTDDSGIGDAHAEPSVGPYRVEKANDLMFRLILEFAAFKPCDEKENNSYQIANGEDDKLEVSCYPIPAKDFILVDLKTEANLVEILDAEGKVISTTESLPIGVTSIDVTNLLPGTYFVKVTKDKKTETITIVKI